MKKVFMIVLSVVFLVSCGEKSKLSIGLIKPSTDHLPIEIGIANGLIDPENIDIKYFNSGWETNEAIANGKVDLAILPFTYVWKDVEKGKPVKIISFLERESDGIITKKSIKKLSDLNGKRIGVLKASTLDIFSEMFEQKHNLSFEQVYFRTPMDMAAALKSGEVDGLSYYVPSIFKFDDKFHILHWYGDDWQNHPCCDLAVNTDSFKAKKDEVIELKKSIQQAVEILNSDKALLYETAAKNYGLTEKIVDEQYQHQHFIMNLDEKGKDFQWQTVQKMIEMGYSKREIKKEDVFLEIE